MAARDRGLPGGGGGVFLRVLLPAAIGPLDPEQREGVFLRSRRAFKLVVHPAVLVFVATGAYNAWKNWNTYKHNPGLMHGLFGVHLLLALAVMAISLWLLAGREPVRGHRSWMRFNVLLMFLAVLAASSLKYARDHAGPKPAADTTPAGKRPSEGPADPATKPVADRSADAGSNAPVGLREGEPK